MPYSDDNLDELLSDARSLLGSDAQQCDRKLRETPEFSDLRDAPTMIRRSTTGSDLPDWGDAKPPSADVYHSDFSDSRFRESFSPRQQNVPARHQPAAADSPPKKRLGCLVRVLLILLALALLLFAAFAIFGKPEKKNAIHERKSGVTTILLAGTDESGLRTDTVMLLSINELAKEYRLLSIPHDTLTFAPYAFPKISGAYAREGGGRSGMDALIDLVEDCVGFPPDGYFLIDTGGLASFIDQMGGIDFDIPADIRAGDVSVAAGPRRLSGAEALLLLCFRESDSSVGLSRIGLQRDLLTAPMRQWATPKNLTKLPSLLTWLRSNTLTDLSLLNTAWLARDLLVCTCSGGDTLPGETRTVGGSPYYVLDPAATAALITEHYNPYKDTITADDLYINVG